MRTETKFGHVALANDDRSRFFLPLDDPAIKVGYIVFVQRRAIRGADALRFMEIFDCNRQAVQRAKPLTVCQCLVGRSGLRHQLFFRNQRHHRIDFPID